MMDDKEIQNVIRQNSSLHDALSSNVISELNLKYCTGCSACAAVCAQSAITMQTDREGFLKPQIDTDKCMMCGVCPEVSAAASCAAKPCGACLLCGDGG